MVGDSGQRGETAHRRARPGHYRLSHLGALEAHAIHVFREVAAEFERPVLLFSGGKDSIVMLHLAKKAFWPAPVPFPVLHIDTGRNFDEVLEFRDRHAADVGVRVVVAKVQDDIDAGRTVEDTSPGATRNRLQTPTLLRAIREGQYDAVFGGARRDEEKARAKERIFSFRDEFGQWDPKNQRPELWNIYNARHNKGEHIRVFPLSNWTELDVWHYIRDEEIACRPSTSRTAAEVFQRDGMLMAVTEHLAPAEGETIFETMVRFRTVGDADCTGCVESMAETIDLVGRGRRHPPDRAGRHEGRRPHLRGRDGGPQARGILLMTELLRLATAGSVDDGKSTLIGRLLYDAKGIFEDQLEAIRRTSEQRGNPETDLALLTDGLRAEREQGITIDVAYRYFATPKRKFIIADTPGHTEYTRNMVTGASNAHMSLILIDARKGVIEQTRRHAFLSSMLGVPHMVVCVNKMDLVDWNQDRYEEIKSDFMEFAARLNVHDITFIPISALRGDNVVQRSDNMWWYDGSPLLNHLESVYIGSDENFIDPRFPVQYVIRSQTPDAPTSAATRGRWPAGFSVRATSCWSCRRGRPHASPPSLTADGEVAEAFPPMAVVITLTDDIAVSRGDILPAQQPANVSHDIEATVCWMDERSSLAEGRTYLLKHSTRTVRAMAEAVHYRLDINGLHRDEVASTLAAQRDRPGVVPLHRALAGRRLHDEPHDGQLHHHRPDHQRHGRGGGDPGHRDHARQPQRRAPRRAAVPVRSLRRTGAPGGTLLFTGLSGAGKSTLASAVEEAFVRSGRPAFLLDGDNLRHGLNGDLGFSDRDRTENVRRAGEVARMFAEAGSLALIALICPFEEDRRLIRTMHEEAGLAYAEVFVDTSLEECERRDPKGLYARARAGQLPGFTGIDSAYEMPSHPDLVVGPGSGSLSEQVSTVIELVEDLLR